MMTNRFKLVFLLIGFLLFIGSACQDKNKKPKAPNDPRLLKNRSSGNVQTSMEDKTGKLWFGTTDNGLYRFNGKKFEQVLQSNGQKLKAVNCLYEDKDGAIWIGTETGLYVFKNKSLLKITIPTQPNQPINKNKFYQKSKAIFNIIQSKSGTLWFATIQGVYTHDGKSFKPFIIDKNGKGYLNTNHNIEYMLEDKSGTIWFGGRGNEGVYRYDGKAIFKQKLPSLTLQFGTRKVSHNWAWPQLQDKNGAIWFSNWAGVYRYDGATLTSFSQKNGLPGFNGLVSKIIEDRNGVLWFGGDVGLTRFYNGKFFNYRKGLSNTWVWTILEDKTGKIWVGTRDTGLYFFDGTRFIDCTATI